MQEQIWNRVFQFSPPRGGRRRALHRPGGGATISILAPAWGRPRLPVMPGISPSYFNSRPRVGGVVGAALAISGLSISILAPAWGASRRRRGVAELVQFQFSPPRGGRPTAGLGDSDLAIFQFSPPRGGRPL